MKKNKLIIFFSLIVGLIFTLIITVIAGIGAFGSSPDNAAAAIILLYSQGLFSLTNVLDADKALLIIENSHGWYIAIFIIGLLVAIIQTLSILIIKRKNKQ